MYLDYNLRIEQSKPFSDDEIWSLWKKGIKVGTANWGYIKEFRDYYGILDAKAVVEAWLQEHKKSPAQ